VPSSLTIDTNVQAATLHASPAAIDTASVSLSPIPQISKLDLHSTAEDDASSETSSTGPSKPQLQTQTNVFNNFTPRSSLDMRDQDREFLSIRQQNQTRRLPRSPLSRPSSDVAQKADTLIMGYAQITGNFMIDEALINATEFDEVKSKGVMGGKSGGGVVGVDARRSSASWTGLGSLGTSFGLGTLFGGTQPSSLAEMRDRAASKTIPILSTPPSILFVDIRLLPGESRSFSYTFKLPRNLPPSHSGRVLRISYSLVITTQRRGMSGQHLSTAEIPFRLFSNLDGFPLSWLC
jgi:RAB6A-GEF complex partner protein 2